MIIIFWEMTPCGSYKNRRFGGSYRLHLQGARVRALQSEVESSCIGTDSYESETSVLIRATRCHSPEDDNHHSHRRGNLKFYKNKVNHNTVFADIQCFCI
jgi:hypothetical protein